VIAREKQLNTIYDATLRDEISSLQRASAYEKAGYDIDGMFIHVSPENATKRAAARFMREKRYVPLGYVYGSRSNEKTFDALIPKFRKWQLFDNNGDKPVLLASGKKGDIPDPMQRDAVPEEDAARATKLEPIKLDNGDTLGPESFESDRPIDRPQTHSDEFLAWIRSTFFG
jgi:hypothetical protein